MKKYADGYYFVRRSDGWEIAEIRNGIEFYFCGDENTWLEDKLMCVGPRVNYPNFNWHKMWTKPFDYPERLG